MVIVRNRFGGLVWSSQVRFRLRCNGRVNGVIIDVTIEIKYICIYTKFFFILFLYKYNVKTCMYTISALYQKGLI